MCMYDRLEDEADGKVVGAGAGLEVDHGQVNQSARAPVLVAQQREITEKVPRPHAPVVHRAAVARFQVGRQLAAHLYARAHAYVLYACGCMYVVRFQVGRQLAAHQHIHRCICSHTCTYMYIQRSALRCRPSARRAPIWLV